MFMREIDLNESIINSNKDNEEGYEERWQYCVPDLNTNVEELEVGFNQFSLSKSPISFDLNEEPFIKNDTPIQIGEILQQSNSNNCKYDYILVLIFILDAQY